MSPLDITQEQKAGILERMKRKIDSPRGRHIYSQRLGTVEPVFGHLTDAIGINRFSYRGKRKVDGQWKLMMMLHNIPEDPPVWMGMDLESRMKQSLVQQLKKLINQ